LKGLHENGGWSLSLTSAVFQEGFALKHKKNKNKKQKKTKNLAMFYVILKAKLMVFFLLYMGGHFL
jgi:hypothetical protein